MKKTLKVIHLVAVSCFLGSIVTYIMFGILAGKEPVALHFNRVWVNSSTTYLTISAMWVAGITGLLMSGIPRANWLKAKLLGFVVIVANTYMLVGPAVTQSLQHVDAGGDKFASAVRQEAIFGGVNLVLIVLLITLSVAKPFGRKQRSAVAQASTA